MTSGCHINVLCMFSLGLQVVGYPLVDFKIMDTKFIFFFFIVLQSSNINEGIKAVLFFKRKDFTRTKSAKRKHATFTQMFFMSI